MIFFLNHARMFICLVTLVGGTFSMITAKETSSVDWNIISPKEAPITISFPNKPSKLSFNLPLDDRSKIEKLHIYSSCLKNKGLLVLSILNTQKMDQLTLKSKIFKDNFYHYLVKHFFHDPHSFMIRQTFKTVLHDSAELPILSFDICYGNKNERKKISGVAFCENSYFYHLFYINTETNFNEDILKEFVSTFEFKN